MSTKPTIHTVPKNLLTGSKVISSLPRRKVALQTIKIWHVTKRMSRVQSVLYIAV